MCGLSHCERMDRWSDSRTRLLEQKALKKLIDLISFLNITTRDYRPKEQFYANGLAEVWVHRAAPGQQGESTEGESHSSAPKS